ncbi:hypothetical protein [Streptomyces sp. NPDC016626]|uniref:hypothetical protein n=1 Tax=Streptomyces sp. NPDC016626 TaxID=3364968 RepID=UPI0036FA3E4F
MMTPPQVLAVAALGGLAAIIISALFIALALGLYTIIDRIVDLREDHRVRRAHKRQQRADLATCQAISSLPTAHHPRELS